MRKIPISLTLLTLLLVLLIAALAGGSLWILGRAPRQAARAETARRVVDQGMLMTAHLAAQPAVLVAGAGDEAWAAFMRQVRALHSIEPGLQSVAVVRDGVTVFSKQTHAMDAGASDFLPLAGVGDVQIHRRLLSLDEGRVPVIVFTRRTVGEDGGASELELTIRADSVVRQGAQATAAVASMFKLSLATLMVAFALCAGGVAWMMRREGRLEAQRQQQEHLAFAGVMANGIVHDFRNPMSSVRLDVQMLGREAVRAEGCRLPRVAELAGRIESTIGRMDKVFQEFLYVSRPGSEERERTDLKACVRECMQMVAPRFAQAGIVLDVVVPDGDVAVMAYGSALQRALLNVVANAEHFSKAGGRVAVNLRQEGGEAVITVDDSGPGVPVDRREAIFEMFVTGRPGGTGLGLFLARTAVERCGGRIGVVDAPGGGARFEVRLPVCG